MKTKYWFGMAMVAALLLTTAGLVVAQEAAEAEAVSLTGCLVEADGVYTLEAADGKKATVVGDMLADHSGHKVTLTGTWAKDDDGNKVFNVDEVEHVAASCE
jgi:hypothetical protein